MTADGGARILVFGATGQVARCLARAPRPAGWWVTFLGRAEADLTDGAAIARAVAVGPWDAVVNAAAYTAVDRAEVEAALAFAVNAEAPGRMAAAAAVHGIPFLHLSTDYVFAGDQAEPYRETDAVAPQSVYGASKAAGEALVRAAGGPHAIVRTAWVYSPFGANFVKTMLRLARERDRLRVVDDQRGNPTAADDIAAMLVRVLTAFFERTAPAAGTYHFCGRGTTTWHGFAAAILTGLAGTGAPVPPLHPIPTAEYPTPARRPANSALDTALIERTFAVSPRPWQDGLADCLKELLGPA